MSNPLMPSLLTPLFSSPAMRLVVDDRVRLQRMLDVEAALARAEAAIGIIPASAADPIVKACQADRYDLAAIAEQAVLTGNVAIPLVKALTDEVAKRDAEAAGYVHWGATSQDVIDTGVVLCLKPACARVAELAVRLGNAAADLARRHAATPTAARTLLQPALPVTFGWKAAVWLSMLSRSLAGTRGAASHACILQFGGPSGTLSSFGERGTAVMAGLAQELELPASAVPWHSTRDRFARLGAELAILAGAAGKIGRDVSLLMQAEVGEAAEAAKAGRGGSSSMPHKRNPALSMLALEAAQRTPALAATLLSQLTPEHERGLGQWQSQWFTLRELVCASASGTAAMADALEGLEVNEAKMRANLTSLLRDPAEDFGAAGAMIEHALGEWKTATSPGTAP